MDEPATAQKALEKNNHTVDLLKNIGRKAPDTTRWNISTGNYKQL
jgi:hypothetical protein